MPPRGATALRRASDAAYAAVQKPVEGTILTVIRALADEAEARTGLDLPELFAELVRRGDDGGRGDARPARGPPQGGRRRLRGGRASSRSSAASRPTWPASRCPEAVEAERLAPEAVHQEASRYRYCTVFVVEGERLDAHALERELTPLGDSLLVVGDARALKAHVHTDDPGAALRAGTALGVIEGVEIANMHVQSAQREDRLATQTALRARDRGRGGGRRRGQSAPLREHGRNAGSSTAARR